MNLSLPKALEIGGIMQPVRYDFRVILDIIEMLNDGDLTEEDKVEALLTMFYMFPEEITDQTEAVQACFRFIDHQSGDRQRTKPGPQLIDWEQDIDLIIPAVNHVLGREIREIEYVPETNTGGLHWWTFLSAFMEIGEESLFSQVLSIRDKRARGKKLEKHEREFWSRNRDLVEIRTKFTAAENDILKEWT